MGPRVSKAKGTKQYAGKIEVYLADFLSANSGKRERPRDNSEQRFSRATSRALPADRGAPRRQASSGGVVAKESKGAGMSTSWDCMTSHLVKLIVMPL